MLSIDRYSTVKHPRVLQLRKKHLIPILFALFAWLCAGLLSTPFLFIYQSQSHAQTVHARPPESITTNGTSSLAHTTNPSQKQSLNPITATITTQQPQFRFHWNATRQNSHSRSLSAKRRQMCTHDLSTVSWYTSFILIHTVCVFIVPGFGILINHLRVRKKLCALSLTARAAHGELPLPMPLLRRPTHVIIVTGMANNNALVRPATSASYSDNRRRKDVKRKPTSKRLGPDSSRNSNNNSNVQHRSKNVQPPMGNPEFPLPQTSTLRSRRRLANILVTAAFLFLFCWAPYAVSVVYCQFNKSVCNKNAIDLGMLIGE